MRKIVFVCIIALLSFTLNGCKSPASTPTSTSTPATPTTTPVSTPSSTATTTPSASPSGIPSPTSTPIISPSASPLKTPSPTPVHTPLYLKLGDKGENVRQLQISLNKFHYMLTADGVFGKLTEFSVKNFQGKTGLIADGIAGPATFAKLDSTPAKAPYLYVYNSGTDANTAAEKATVLFTFDDGYKDVITVAADILKEKNFKGTAYVYEAGIIGGYSSSMNLSDLNKLYADYGWDIGNHTAHHSIKGDISDPAYLHAVEKDYLDNQNWLLLNGWTRSAYHAAYVGGVYNIELIDYLKGIGVKTGRAAWSGGMPANDLYQIQCIDVSLNSLTDCEKDVDKAVSSKSTLVFSIHKINTAGGTYVIKTPDFQSLVDYVSNYVLQDKLVVTTISGYYNSLK